MERLSSLTQWQQKNQAGTYQSPECFKPFFDNLGGSNTKGHVNLAATFWKTTKQNTKKKKTQKTAGSTKLSLRVTVGLTSFSLLHGLATHGVIRCP